MRIGESIVGFPQSLRARHKNGQLEAALDLAGARFRGSALQTCLHSARAIRFRYTPPASLGDTLSGGMDLIVINGQERFGRENISSRRWEC